MRSCHALIFLTVVQCITSTWLTHHHFCTGKPKHDPKHEPKHEHKGHYGHPKHDPKPKHEHNGHYGKPKHAKGHYGHAKPLKHEHKGHYGASSTLFALLSSAPENVAQAICQ